MDKFFDWASTMVDDLPKVGKAAVAVGIVVVLLTGPITWDALHHPDQRLFEVAMRTLPLTLAVCAVVVAITKQWFSHAFSYVLFAAFAAVLSGGVADYVHCENCGGTALIRSAQDEARDWTPQWLSDNGGPLNAIPFLLFALAGYFRFYGFGTFVASFLCGWFLAAILMRIAALRVKKSS
jgi:hypothetical protein